MILPSSALDTSPHLVKGFERELDPESEDWSFNLLFLLNLYAVGVVFVGCD